MGKHRGRSETGPIETREFEELTPAEQFRVMDKQVDFDTQEAAIQRGSKITPPAV